MSQQPTSSRPDLMAGVRVRVPLVFVVPIASLLLVGVVSVLFAQVLLSLPKEAATTVALAFAANILIACTVLALRQRTDAVTLAELFVVVSYPVVIGVVLAVIGFGATEHGAHGEAAAAEGGGGGEQAGGGATETIVAANVAFETNEVHLPAGEETTLTLDNQDSVAHNFSIYTDDSAEEDLFVGQNVDGGGKVDYTIPPLDKGEYFFRCDLHPSSMTGTAIVE